MSKVPFATCSDGVEQVSMQTLRYDEVAGEPSGSHEIWRRSETEETTVDLHSSDDLSETGDIGVGQESYASYQKSGRKKDQLKMSETGGFEDDFVNINSSLKQRKSKSYLWLRHPKVRENWKTVTGALFLLVIGILFLICGIVLSAIPKHDGPKSVIFFVCAAVCILPGGYHTVYIYRATKGWRGYNFESLPNFQ